MMDLQMIFLNVSPMPMGLIPGHLFKGINLQATKASIPKGSTSSVHMRLVRAASALQSSAD
jgi:hypothetical protein